MARYTEAACRVCRRSGDKLFLKGAKCYTKCTLDRRPRPPGQHGQRRTRVSDRGLQLREKQKARYSYGVLERQFRRFFGIAARQQGITAENFLVLLERRLDNVVYRLGFADSRPQARQLVQHGLILLNGRPTKAPSGLVKEGDTVSWKENKTRTEYYKQLVESIKAKVVPGWLSLDRQKLEGRVVSLPIPDEIGAKFDAQAIVEYYSR
ncbi:MAG: 30S ribosomal protein S4 [Dehalococcoidales bacterium]|nr:30S ribosomal protein S4 [Dehalococcoidales bacterium]